MAIVKFVSYLFLFFGTVYCASLLENKIMLFLISRHEKKQGVNQQQEEVRTSELLGGGYLPE